MTRTKRLITLIMLAITSIAFNLIPNEAPGGITLNDSGQSLGSDWSNDVVMGDIDNDGDQDAIVANSSVPNQLWLNQGGVQGGSEGIFQLSGQVFDNLTFYRLALGDLDGDLDLDIFVVRGSPADSMQVWINQGGTQGGTVGTFQRNAFTNNDETGTDVALGDVDGDNDLDAYVPHVFGSDLIYLNDGTGMFTDSGQALQTADSRAADLADLDNDGDLDAFVAGQNGANVVWLNQGGVQGGTEGIFQDSGQLLGTNSSLNVALGDLDNDNDIDAFVANSQANIVWINQGGDQGGTLGTFQTNGQTLGFSNSADVKLGDLDNDNDLDAFVADYGPNIVWVNQGGQQGGAIGTFIDNGLMLGNSISNGVALADADGDIDLDAFVANRTSPSNNKLYINGTTPNPTSVNPEGWQMQLLDTRGDTGTHPAVAIDSQGFPHIIQTKVVEQAESRHFSIYHVFWDGVRWHKELIDTGFPVGRRTAIAIDTNDVPHVAYAVTGGDNEGIYHAFWNGDFWQKQQIESADFFGNVALDVDSNGNPHVTYVVTQPARQFMYAYWDGAAWQKHAFDQTSVLGVGFTDIVINHIDRPQIAYYHEGEQAMKHAYFSGVNWTIETVDSNGPFHSLDHFFSIDMYSIVPVIAYYKNNGQTLSLAMDTDTNWLLGDVLTLDAPDHFTGNVSMALDQNDDFYIAYARFKNSSKTDLYLAYLDGNRDWEHTLIDNSGVGREGQHLDIAMGANDKPVIAYKDMVHSDLRYVSWDKTWQVRTVADQGQTASVDLQMKDTKPYLSYYNLANNFLNLGYWDTEWEVTPADAANILVPETSLAVSPNTEHVSYYDADTQDLVYARHGFSGWNQTVVESQGDVGRYNQILLSDYQTLNPYIIYWDETNRQIKLAVYDYNTDTFDIHPNLAAPTLPPGSGPLSASIVEGENVGIIYYEANTNGLRYAVWNKQSGNWIDEIVDNFPGNIGRLNSVQTDDICGCPAVAYYDESNDTIKYAQRIDGIWQIETVKTNAGGLSDLSLELAFKSRLMPRISYTTADSTHFAYKDNGIWYFEIIADTVANPVTTALALDERPHIAYPDVLEGMKYVFRTATLDIDINKPGPAERLYAGDNPLTPCGSFTGLFSNSPNSVLPADNNFRPLSGGETPLSDSDIYGGMTMLFSQTPQGQDLIKLYFDHASEMAQIGLDDPQLIWDSYGTLQNFLPGLEALVTANGDQHIVTQQMADDALDIWSRIAAVASPQLANTINTKLTQYDDLQDFVGLSFDEWAVEIGVTPPTNNNAIYLPAMFNK